MSEGRRYFGPLRGPLVKVPANFGERGAPEQSEPAGADRKTQNRAGNLREAERNTSQPFLPSASAANAYLEERARAKQRAANGMDALQYLRASDVCRLLRISKPTLWRLRRTRGFPEPTEVTDRLIAWRRSEVEEWLGRAASSRRVPSLPPIQTPSTAEHADSARGTFKAAGMPSGARRKRSRFKTADEQLQLPLKL